MVAASGPFTVTRLPAVDRQIEAIVAQASSRETRLRLIGLLRSIGERLRTDPLAFGEPIYRTKKDGGAVRHGILRPISVHFVVYESEQVACILKVQKPTGWESA